MVEMGEGRTRPEKIISCLLETLHDSCNFLNEDMNA